MNRTDRVQIAEVPFARSFASSDFANEISGVLQSFGIDCESAQEELYDIAWSKICDTYYNASALSNWAEWRWKFKGRLQTDDALSAALKVMTASLNDPYTTFVTAEESERAHKSDARFQTKTELLVGTGGNLIVHTRLARLRSAADIDHFINELSLCCRRFSNRLGGIVLDLRDNPGGYLGFAVQVAALFLKEGLIVTCLARQATVSDRQEFRVEPLPAGVKSSHAGLEQLRTVLQSQPLVVLVNGNTASGAEVITAALQDNKRARVVGTTTFGKRVSYNWEPVGKVGLLSITYSLLISPSGTSVHGRGIKPDVEVQQADSPQDNQLQEAVRVLQATNGR